MKYIYRYVKSLFKNLFVVFSAGSIALIWTIFSLKIKNDYWLWIGLVILIFIAYLISSYMIWLKEYKKTENEIDYEIGYNFFSTPIKRRNSREEGERRIIEQIKITKDKIAEIKSKYTSIYEIQIKDQKFSSVDIEKYCTDYLKTLEDYIKKEKPFLESRKNYFGITLALKNISFRYDEAINVLISSDNNYKFYETASYEIGQPKEPERSWFLQEYLNFNKLSKQGGYMIVTAVDPDYIRIVKQSIKEFEIEVRDLRIGKSIEIINFFIETMDKEKNILFKIVSKNTKQPIYKICNLKLENEF